MHCTVSQLISFSIVECWQSYPNYDGVYYVVSLRQSDPPRAYFFGDTTNSTWCKEQCALIPLCYAYTYFDASVTDWGEQCYGRGFGAPEVMYQDNGRYSGLKLC